MSWKDKLRKASFRGVPFYVDESNTDGGRRLAVHEYPQKDIPYVEDIGRKARRYPINAYVLGDNYMSDRDALADACEKGGSGELIHPYLGSLSVCCESVSFREGTSEGGIAYFSMTFVESGIKIYPDSVQDNMAALSEQADNLISAVRGNFIDATNLVGVSEYVRTGFGDKLSQIGSLFKSLQSSGGLSVGSGSQSNIDKITEITSSVNTLTSPSDDVLTSSDTAADTINTAVSGFYEMSPSAAVAATNLKKFSALTVDEVPGETAQTVIQNTNNSALVSYVKGLAIANEVKAAVRADYSSYEEAMSVKNDLCSRLETMMDNASGDDEYIALADLRKLLSSSLPAEGSSLPHISTLVLNQSAPSLSVAYDLYGNIERADDIALRNGQRHPGFIVGGENLEVLSDV